MKHATTTLACSLLLWLLVGCEKQLPADAVPTRSASDTAAVDSLAVTIGITGCTWDDDVEIGLGR